MNDRFKFRVWKDLEKRMVNNVTHLNPLLLDEEINEENKHNVPMQSTGLKDKNGKLIYEGDIVSNKHKKYLVKWIKAGFILQIINNTFKYPLGCLDTLEVIGNIYENKELLNE